MRIPPPKIETVPIGKLVPWVKNPRKGHAVKEIARSIDAFGYLAPIVVQAKTYRVLAGHGRLAALKEAGVTEVPVIVADIDDDRADLFTLADNKTSEYSDWDFGTMADLILDFDVKGLDTRAAAFRDFEVERIVNWTPDEKRAGKCPTCGKRTGGKG
jgi:hypothetical protein